MSKKLDITLNTTLALVGQFQAAISAPSGDRASTELSGKDALPLLSASSTALKSQVTKLSLLTITAPFTHSAVVGVLFALNESVLPSLVTAALLITPNDHTKAFQAEAQVLTRSTLRELFLLLTEVQSVAKNKDEAKKAQKKEEDLSQEEKNVVTIGAGRVWEACDTLIDFAARGVIGFVTRRVEEWRDLVRDAVDEIEDWDPDEESDEFFDELLSDDGKKDAGKEDGESDEESDEESNAALHEQKKNALRILKPVAQIYPAIITNRLKKAPELSPSFISKLESLMENLKQIPDNVDEVAGALYEDNLEKSNQYLRKTRSCAVSAIESTTSPWSIPGAVGTEQKTEDKFTTWSKTWLKVMDGVSKSVDSEATSGK